jgi:hypothetical protein
LNHVRKIKKAISFTTYGLDWIRFKEKLATVKTLFHAPPPPSKTEDYDRELPGHGGILPYCG